jgi:hypothetical protein
VSSPKQWRQTRRGFELWLGSRNRLFEHGPQTTAPHLRQWCLRLINVNCDFLQRMQTEASPSGTQTAACSSTAFLPLFLSKSSMHLFMWAIHSCFSVAVAAYTAKDLEAVRMNQPFRNSESETRGKRRNEAPSPTHDCRPRDFPVSLLLTE